MKSIIIATDFSQTATNAAQYAVQISPYLSVDTLVIYHSFDNELYVNTDIPVQNQKELQLQWEKSLKALEMCQKELEKLAPARISVKSEINDQPLISGIEVLITQYQAVMVVCGTTGKSNLEQVLIGSNAINLAKEISIPLLLIPAAASFSTPKQAVLACDLKHTEETLPLQSVRYFVNAFKLKLHILNVQASDSELIADTIPQQYKLHELLDDLNPTYDYVQHHDAATAIMTFADQHGVDFIISIKKSYGFFKNLFHKSITKKLAFKSKTPLLLLGSKGD